MMELIKDLASLGYHLDVFLKFSEMFLKPDWPDSNITVFPINAQQNELDLQSFIVQQHQIQNYSAVFGCNPEGLIEGYPIARQLDVPLVYISFEIYFRDELESEADLKQKQLEMEASKNVDLVIIQDELRAELLAGENNINLSKFVLLPVSPEGPAIKTKSRFLRNKFQIEKDRIIVLHSGRFSRSTFGQELVEAAHSWPDNYVLIIHTRFNGAKSKYVSQEMNKSDPSKVKFSTEPVTYDEYDTLVSSCDIGLAFQKKLNTKSTQKNTYHIGFSSGKFSYYTKFGKPIITNQLPTYASLFRRYPAGLCVSEMAEIEGAIDDIVMNYERMSKSSIHLFNDKLDPDKYFPEVFDRIEMLLR
jgi:hypothetical protein